MSFSEARREDLVLEYSDELEVLRKLLPKPVGEREICSFIGNDQEYFSQFEDEYLNEKGEIVKGIQIPKKEMGNAIKYLKSKFPQADGKLISGIVKGVLKATVISNFGKSLAGNLLKFIPGVGTLAGGTINAGVAVGFTEALGFAIVGELRGTDNADLIDLANVIKDVLEGFTKK